jgi:hypothetical protein
MIGIANAPVVRDVLPALFAGRRPAAVEAVGDLMERYKVPLRYAGAQAGRMASPSEQTPEDYTMTNIENPIAVSATQGYPSQNTAGLAAVEEAAAPAAAAAEVPLEGPTIDPATGRTIELRADGLYYVKGTNELAFPDRDPLLDRSNPAAMYRGGTVQAFRNGGMASIADLARHYGMRR